MSVRKALVPVLALTASLAFVATAAAIDVADAYPPSGTTGVPYSYTFSLSPGSGSPGVTWSVSSGQLPPGLALSSNDRTATVYGTPTQAGAFSFYLQVRDAPGPWHCCAEDEFTIVIEEGLGIATPELPVATVGASYGYQLATTGGSASGWALTSGVLPAGMALSADGALTGTPTQAALSQLTVRAVNGSRHASKQLTLKVAEPIVVSAPLATTVKAGEQFLVAFAARGGLAPYTWSGVSLPDGVEVNPKTGQVSGSPGTRRQDVGYQGVSLSTLRTWLGYWEGVKSGGTSKLAPGSKDTVEMAPGEISKLTKEIAARTKPSMAKAPAPTGRFTLTVKVTDALGTTTTASTTVSAVERVAIVTAKLPMAHYGKRFTATLRTAGGAGPLELRLAGATPRWLRLVDGGTRLAGTPTLRATKRPATYNLYVTAVDSIGQRSTRMLKLIVKA